MQDLVLSRLFNSADTVHAVFLAGLFLIVVFRRESIAIPGLFKLAYWLFALSIVLPAITLPLVQMLGNSSSARFGGPAAFDAKWVANLIYSAAGPAVFALSVLCAFGSMFPRNLPAAPTRAPEKHPLD